jgi:hypothetical protein
MKIIYTHFLFLTFSFLSAQTEKNVNQQSLLWTRYYNQIKINTKWSLHSEFDNRLFINTIKENLFMVRVNGRYKINKNTEIGSGFSYFSVSTQDPEIKSNFNIPEYRGQQDITWKKELGNSTLNQRFQIEERFLHNANKQSLLPGTTYNWRFRYRFQADFNCWKKKDQYLKTIVYDEIMINAGRNIINNTFDQNRIYAAIQYGINKSMALELGYLKSFQKRASGVEYFDRDIIRFTFFQKINLKKK